MSNNLLDYFFPIVSNTPTAPASTAFLKQAIAIVKPKDIGVETGVIVECTSQAEIAALTNSVEPQELLNAGMSRVFVLPVDDLDVAAALVSSGSKAYTVLISSDFDDADITSSKAVGNATITTYTDLLTGTPDTIAVGGVVFTAQAGAATLGTATFQAATSNDATAASLAAQVNAHAIASTKVVATPVAGVCGFEAKEGGSQGNLIALAYVSNGSVGATVSGATLTGGDGLYLGTFAGVVGVSSDDDSFLEVQAIIANRVAFLSDTTVYAKNMFYAFGKLLANRLDWKNQQYITMPYGTPVNSVGDADALFEKKISFVLDDNEYGARLALFVAGGKAIVAPYIKKNLMIDEQSAALTYVSVNQPQYTITEAALIEDELDKVITAYILKKWIDSGDAIVALEQQNFVASGYINISEPTALWRLYGQITENL